MVFAYIFPARRPEGRAVFYYCAKIAFNVPAVYEGFYGAIKKTAKQFCAIKTLGGVERGSL
jgi:hypothetical protein